MFEDHLIIKIASDEETPVYIALLSLYENERTRWIGNGVKGSHAVSVDQPSNDSKRVIIDRTRVIPSLPVSYKKFLQEYGPLKRILQQGRDRPTSW